MTRCAAPLPRCEAIRLTSACSGWLLGRRALLTRRCMSGQLQHRSTENLQIKQIVHLAKLKIDPQPLPFLHDSVSRRRQGAQQAQPRLFTRP